MSWQYYSIKYTQHEKDTRYAEYERNPAKHESFPYDARRCKSCGQITPRDGGYMTLSSLRQRKAGRGKILVGDWRCRGCIDKHGFTQC